MRFIVYGAGALGSLVAARLANAYDVVLVGRRDHVDAINRTGLRVTGKTELHQTALHAAVEAPDEAPEIVLVTVKAYDTRQAMGRLRGYGASSVFVSLQNGLGNEEVMAEHVPRVLGAVINQGVTFLEPGAVYHAGEGETEIGPFEQTSEHDAHQVVDAFNEVGLPARAVADVRERVWLKAVLNAAVNPLTALFEKRTGELLDDENLETAMRIIVSESVAIARASGVHFTEDDVLDKIMTVARATRINKSSMLQDLERGRRTEIDAINGAIVQRAREHAMASPVNSLLTALVHAAEKAAR